MQINDPEELSQVIVQAFKAYDFATKSRTNLQHRAVYEYCLESITYTAIASKMISGDPRPRGDEALAWVESLPEPNGLYQDLITAYSDLDDQSVPLLNFIISYPVSTHNIHLVKDALYELLHNLEKADTEGHFNTIIPSWYQRI